jgi:hypothetical protein
MATTNESSDSGFGLAMLNLWIGLCRGVGGLPKDVHHLGFRDKEIEFSFKNASNETIKPELIICSQKLEHTLLLEWKSGKNTEVDQLDRYSRVVPPDIRARVPSGGACKGHDVVIIAKIEHRDSIAIGIDKKHKFPLLCVESDGISLNVNRFSHAVINPVFAPKLKIDFTRRPSSFIPFDATSPEWMIATEVIPQILQLMHEGETVLLLDAILPAVVDVWSHISPQDQRTLREKVERVITRAADGHFKPYLKRNRAYEAQSKGKGWDIENSPLNMSSSKRGQEFRRLQKLQKEFVEELRSGRTGPQPDLFLDGSINP